MAVAIYLLLLLGQLPRIIVSGLDIEATISGPDCISFSSTYGHEPVYMDGHILEKDIFPKGIHSANLCGTEAITPKSGSALLSINLPAKAGRKLLQEEVKENPTAYSIDQEISREDEHGFELSISKKIVIVAASGLLLLCCSLLCPCFRARRRGTSHADLEPNSLTSIERNPFEMIPGSPLRVPHSPRFEMSQNPRRLEPMDFTLSQIIKATRNFSPSLQIGDGGFGTVYKAHLQDGQVVAIKRAKKEHFENIRTEFSSEVELLSKIDHRSLVKLLGYIEEGNERLIITEYLSNGTLREHLDGQYGKFLDFNQRLEISIDIAHGLTNLHLYAEKQIIHRDVKSSNILLTEHFKAKVADFGFARYGDSEQTHILTKVKGTMGYLDPEYMKTYQLTPKSDVYSFGVLLIEILTGRRPVELKKAPDEKVTLRWAFKKYNEGSVADLVDPSMGEVVDTDTLVKMFSLAIQCAAPTRSDRPDMKTVGEQLWKIRMNYLRSARRGV